MIYAAAFRNLLSLSLDQRCYPLPGVSRSFLVRRDWYFTNSKGGNRRTYLAKSERDMGDRIHHQERGWGSKGCYCGNSRCLSREGIEKRSFSAHVRIGEHGAPVQNL